MSEERVGDSPAHLLIKTLYGVLNDESGSRYRVILSWNPAGPAESVTQTLVITVQPEGPGHAGLGTVTPRRGQPE